VDANLTSKENILLLNISLAEAKDICDLVNNFRHWEMISSVNNKEPMLFILEFGRECGFAAQGCSTLSTIRRMTG